MFMLLQMKAGKSFQGFVSSSYLGEVVPSTNTSNPKLMLEKVCVIYEVLSQSKKGEQVVMDIMTKFYTNSLVTNGILTFDKEDVLFSRAVDEGDELLTGYRDAIEAMRLHKINIQKASSVSEIRGHN